MVMARDDCKIPFKTQFFRTTSLPSKLVPGAIYFVESNPSDEYVDMYTSDRSGRKKVLIDGDRIITTPILAGPILLAYESDIHSTSYYYYGYEYNNNEIKILRVEIGNVVNQNKAINLLGTFTDNWNNRVTLTYA